MKKIICTLCVTVVLLAFSACGGSAYNGNVDHDARILAEKVIDGNYSNLQQAVSELQEFYSKNGYDQFKVAQVSIKAGEIIAKKTLK